MITPEPLNRPVAGGYLDGLQEVIADQERRAALDRYAARWAELITKWAYAQAGGAYPQLTENDRMSLQALTQMLNNTL